MPKIFSPFLIRFSGLPEIVLGYVNLNEVHPHEETDPNVLEATRNYITKSKIIRDPIIIDRKTGTILDGTHRYAVANELGLQKIPVASVDYMDNRIRVRGWTFAVIGGTEALNELTHEFTESKHPLPGRINLLYNEEYFYSEEQDPRSLLKKAREIKVNIEKIGGVVLREAFPNKNLPVLLLPYPNKWEVINSAVNHDLFPPKSTRHVIPGRPLNLNFSIESYEEIEKLLFKRTIRLMHPRSRIGRKIFEEEVLFFKTSD
ncbi:MAG: ParB N-terminal domain-containing protein [Thermoprotei archaeon]